MNDKKQDILIKYIFVLGECGNCTGIKKLDPKETFDIYKKIGDEMRFEQIKGET